jgi:septum formation inhibitor MinC
MTVIRVNPQSVKSYGNTAQNIFNTMHESLVGLVNDVVGVRYFGPNAVSFKSECGRVAADFANRLHQDMAAMADAVKQSTSNIAASLGGAPIVIQIDPKAITPPQPQSVDYVDVDTDALSAVVGVVNKWFGALDTGLSSNLSGLQATDWEGNAKIAAVDSVNGFTSSARNKCETTKQTIVTYINNQVEAAHGADK